ncbi:MAG TPA: ABC transporter permease [Vicinamibacterales bacterium]|nr:ABC transporter permease [Vicinamibacterales bacterium]
MTRPSPTLRRARNVLFSIALLAYPRAFRRRFGDEMRHAFHHSGAVVPSLFAHLVSGIKERWSAVVRWSFYPNSTPHLYEPSGRHLMFWEMLRADIRHTLRLAVKTPVFTALTVLALALGIGATTAIFAVVNGVLLQSLPYRDDSRLVNLWSNNTSENRPRNPISPANFLDFQKMNTTLDGLEGYFTFVTPTQMQTDAGSEIGYSVFVTSNLFTMLGRNAALGRVFAIGEESGVTVISDGYWRRRFGADPNIVGKTLTLNGLPWQIIGVMPPDFVFPYSGMLGPSGFTRVTGVDMWLPIAFSGPMAANNRMLTPTGQVVRNVHWWGAIGRLKPGISAVQAEADMKTIAQQLEQSYPNTNKGWSATIVPSIDQSVGGIRPALLILMAGIAFVLVMASVNVANLLLARSIAREKELATRAALGAGRARIARQLLTESVLFAIAGGLVGMIVMWWTVRGLIALAPPDLPRMNEVAVNWRVLLAAGLTTMITGILVGVLPALSSASVNPQASLQDASRGTVGGALRRRARAGLVIAEVALAVAITTGAALLLRSFVSVTNVNPGFDTSQLLTWQMNLPQHLANANSRLAFYRDFFARMEALPGVVSVGGTTRVPLGSTSVSTSVQIEGRPVPTAELPEVQFRRAMHNYFETMGIPIRRGRGFDPNDGPTAPPVAVINETMARRLFANQDPLGQHIRTGPAPSGAWTTIVGVIGDIRHGGLEEVPQPEMYINYLQGPPVSPFIVLRTTGDPALLAETVRAEARRIDKNLPLYDMRTMSTLRSEAVSTRRFVLLIVGAFGALALGLAAIGVYGVMSLIVSERTREVGVRLALGAEPSRLLGMIVMQAAKLAGVGVVIGVIVALPLAPLLDSQLYGIQSFDPMTFISVPLVLLATATLAAVVPARKAMRIDPLAALRID